MNPVGILVVALGLIIIIVGFKGSQHRIASSLTNKAPKS